MKIFEKIEGFSEKVNFVDENDVFVGFDMTSNCCENFGYFILDELNETLTALEMFNYNSNIIRDEEIKDFVFDKSFFKEINEEDELGDIIDIVIFRLINDNKEKYLYLFNNHNGYYYHGFVFEDKGTELKKGIL